MGVAFSYSDISEVCQLRYLTPEILAEYESAVKTPLAFVNFADRVGYGNAREVTKILQAAGWEHVTSCLNWHIAHLGDVEMRLWMKKFEKPIIKRQVCRQHDFREHLSFASGCGGRIIEPQEIMHEDILATNPKWARFLTLLRVPKEESVDEEWLRAMNYRPLPQFSSSVAGYWVNGFERWSREVELEFWKKWELPGTKKHQPLGGSN